MQWSRRTLYRRTQKDINSKRLRNDVEANAANQTNIFHVLTAALDDAEAPFVLGNAPDGEPLAASAALTRILWYVPSSCDPGGGVSRGQLPAT